MNGVLKHAEESGFKLQITFPKKGGNCRLRLRTMLPGQMHALDVYPEPPLNFSLNNENDLHVFAPELQELASFHKAKSVLKYVQKRANRRNLVLYAGSDGLPNVHAPEEFILGRRDAVFAILTAFLLIDPYPDHQQFVVQALDVFLRVLNRIHQDEKPEVG